MTFAVEGFKKFRGNKLSRLIDLERFRGRNIAKRAKDRENAKVVRLKSKVIEINC